MSIDLFEPYGIGSLELRNRFVRSATWDGEAVDETGAVTDANPAPSLLCELNFCFDYCGVGIYSSFGR